MTLKETATIVPHHSSFSAFCIDLQSTNSFSCSLREKKKEHEEEILQKSNPELPSVINFEGWAGFGTQEWLFCMYIR